MSVNCPMCSRPDRIQKITAIRASGTKHIQGEQLGTGYSIDTGGLTDTWGTVSGTEVSALAQRLAPPAKPLQPRKRAMDTGRGFTFYFLLSVGWLVLFGMAGMMAVGAGLSWLIVQSDKPFTDSFNMALVIGVVTGATPLILGLIATVLLVTRKPSAQKIAAAQAAHETQLAAWQAWERATQRWQAAYYCHRDDVVFVPNDGNRAWHAHQLKSCLYAPDVA